MSATKLHKKRSRRYIIANGKKQAVIIDLEEMKRIDETIENLQDALAYEKAKREAAGFITLERFKQELKAMGKL